jgi:hypothetical protein
MEFILHTLDHQLERSLKITELDYLNVYKSNELIKSYYNFEQIFDNVVENYYEFEVELLSSSARFIIEGNTDFDWFLFHFSIVVRRLLNVMSTARGYLDQSSSLIKGMLEDPELFQDYDDFKHCLYDEHLGYRVMEALRNYSQHSNLPLKSTSFTTKHSKLSNTSRVTLKPYIKPKNFLNDDKFKASVREELISIGDTVDIKPLLREYIACLGKLHNEARKIIDKKSSSVIEHLNVLSDRYFDLFDYEDDLTFMVLKQSKPNLIEESEYLYTSLDKARKKLRSKNGRIMFIEKLHVSGEVAGEDI